MTFKNFRGQQTISLMHWWLFIETFFVIVAGFQLFVLSEYTNEFFAWTIKSPLTAAFLGACYWSAIPLTLNSFRAKLWANARIAIPGVWVFAVLTTFATFLQWDKFHWSSPLLTAQFAFLAWLVVYITFPIVLLSLWLAQMRAPGGEPARISLMPLWFRALLAVQAMVMLGVGCGLYLAPGALIPIWMWTLTPLTAMAIGAWCIGIALTSLLGARENDFGRVRGAMFGSAVLGALQLLAVARYSTEINWSNPGALLYVIFLLTVLILSGIGMWFVRRADALQEHAQ